MRVPKNQPGPTIESFKPNKKRVKLILWLIVIVFIIIIVPLFIIGSSGLFHLPVVSSIFGTAKAKDLGIATSNEDLVSLQNKVSTRLIGSISDFCLLCQRKFEGEVAINTRITSEEITSFLYKYFDNDEVLSGMQVKMVEGGLEISALLKKPVKIPVYVKVGVTNSGSQSISLSIENAKLGLLPVPEGFREKAQKWFQDKINKRMTEINGFSIQKLDYHDGYGEFIGTFPATVTPSAGKWLTI